jgi:hypothetical protein
MASSRIVILNVVIALFTAVVADAMIIIFHRRQILVTSL